MYSELNSSYDLNDGRSRWENILAPAKISADKFVFVDTTHPKYEWALYIVPEVESVVIVGTIRSKRPSAQTGLTPKPNATTNVRGRIGVMNL